MKTKLCIAVWVVLACLVCADDLKALRKQEAGPVADQLFEYAWEPANANSTVGLSNAIGEFKFWANTVLNTSFRIPDRGTFQIHHGDSNTCDAVKVTYQIQGETITIIQTRMTMLITLENQDTKITDFNAIAATATKITTRFLTTTEDFFPVQTSMGTNYAMGSYRPPDAAGSVSPARAPKKDGFILNRWWGDGTQIAIFGIKVPFGNKAMLVVEDKAKSVQSNLHWF